MAALQCEFCGGKLVTKAGGVCECDSCGMEFDKSWVKEKIQEIKGTVKVEGTVEVTGTVQVAGNATVESLCSRGFFEMENRNSKAAKEAFSRALDIDTNYGDVYMGLIMANLGCSSIDEFYKRLMDRQLDENSKYFLHLMSCPGSRTLNEKVAQYKAMLESQARAKEENAHHGARNAEIYRALRKKYAPIRQQFPASGCELVDAQGNVRDTEDLEIYDSWGRMLSIDHIHGWSRMDYGVDAGIREDGAVIADVDVDRVQIFDPAEQIVQLRLVRNRVGIYQFAGLRRDGGVLFRYYKKDVGLVPAEEGRPICWENVSYLCGGECIGAVCKDGTYQEDSKLELPPYENIAWVERLGDFYDETYVLLEDGTVRLYKHSDKRNVGIVETWSDIIQIAWSKNEYANNNPRTFYGLKADGTVVTTAKEDPCMQWKNVAFLGRGCVGAVTRDGRILGESAPKDPSFRLFRNLDTLEQEREQRRSRAFEAWKKEKARREEERSRLEARQESILQEIAGLNFLAFRRRKELEEELASVLLELEKLAD